MGVELALIALAPLLVLVLFFLYSRNLKKHASPVVREAPPRAPEAAGSSNAGTRRMRRRAAGGASTSSVTPTPTTNDEDEHEEDEEEEAEVSGSKAAKKKAQKKQEKEARRQAEHAASDQRKEKQDRHSQLRRQKDEEREAEEARKEEELRILREKEQAASAEEFDKWKGSFSVDTEGTTGEDTEEGKNLIQDFVDYVKMHKCVALEDLAGEFRLRTQECINRIVSLEQSGRLSGIMDDRGKFIYISPEEMKAVAEYIKRQGRVSISHLARKSNEFIDLESKCIESFA